MRLHNVFLLNGNKLYGCNLKIPHDMTQYVEVTEEYENVWYLKSKISSTGLYNLLGSGINITDNVEIETNKDLYEISYSDEKLWYKSMNPIYTLVSYYLGIDYGVEKPQKITDRDYYYYYYDYVEYDCMNGSKFPQINPDDIIKHVQEHMIVDGEILIIDRYNIIRRTRIIKN